MQAGAKIRDSPPGISSGHEDAVTNQSFSPYGYTTELHCAVFSGSLDCVKLLVEACPTMVNHSAASGKQPLHLAAAYGYWDIMQYLVTVAGASPSAQDVLAATPVHYALQSYMETDATAFALMFPPQIIALVTKCDTCTPRLLARAAMTGSAELVMLFLQEGAHVHEIDSDHRTALHYASQHQRERIVDILLTFDQPPQAIYIKDRDGFLPLHYAAVNADLKIVTSLLAADKTGESLFVRSSGADLPTDLAIGFRKGGKAARVRPEVITVLQEAERELWTVYCDWKSRSETVLVSHKHSRLDDHVRFRSAPADEMDDVAAGFVSTKDSAYLLDSLEDSDDAGSVFGDDSAA